jgi:hypothetical protein
MMAMTMTPDDIYCLMQAADVTLAFDTSVTSRAGFIPLCIQANRINARRKTLGLSKRIHLCVPAAAHTERLFHLAQEHGDRYDVEVARHALRQHRVTVPDFTVQDAEHCAELLAQRYETPAEWYAFRKRRCLECTGLPPNYHDLAKGTGKECGAPNDWLIIAQASRGEMLLVMDDPGWGGEYDLVERIVRYSDVRTALEQLLGELLE